MSGKRRKKHLTDTQLYAQAERELHKGNTRDALKGAKLCFRQRPTTENRQLLERAYLGRIEQLQRPATLDQAKAALAELLQLNPSVPEVRAQIPRLQIVMGLAGQEETALLEANPKLLVELVDRGVIDARAIVPEQGGVREQVARVREALEAVERGADQVALGLLEQLPRRSPLADWKLFVRGLIAFYQEQRERTLENWQRLDPRRPAHRLAETLLVAAGEMPLSSATSDVLTPLARLRQAVQKPCTPALKRLARYWSESIEAFLIELRQFRQRCAITDRPILARLIDMAWKQGVQDEEPEVIDMLERLNHPPALDPHWNRARALLAESEGNDYAGLVQYWQAYARELLELEALSPDERPAAAALAYQRLGRALLLSNGPALPGFRTPKAAGGRWQDEALRCYRECLRLCPRLASAYQELATCYAAEDRRDEAAEVWQQSLEHFPDDVETHFRLADYFARLDQAERARPHMEAFARARPRDPIAVVLRWNTRTAEARQLANEGNFAAARQTLEGLAQMEGLVIEPYVLDLHRAGLEYKAHQTELAGQYLLKALESVEDEAAVWLHMVTVASRYELPGKLTASFDTHFRAAVARGRSSRTAGRMASLCRSNVAHDVRYPGDINPYPLVTKYLRQLRQKDWEEPDLVEAYRFAEACNDDRLRRKLVASGLKRFRHNPLFQLAAGKMEMEQGPFHCKLSKARGYLQRVMQLVAGSDVPEEQDMAAAAQAGLSLLESGAHMQESFDQFDDFDEDDQWDDEDDASGSDSERLLRLLRGLPDGAIEELQRMAGATETPFLEALINYIHSESDAGEKRQSGRSGKGRERKRQR